MPELDDDEREYLAAFVAVATPAAPDVQASLARVEERITAGEGPSVGTLESEPSRPRPWVVLSVATVALAAAVALLFRLDIATRLAGESTAPVPSEAVHLGAEGDDAGGRAVPREPPPPRARAVSPSTVTVDEPSNDPEPAVEVEPTAEVVDEPVRRRRPRAVEPDEPTADEPTPNEPTTDATLHAEIALLRPAQRALRAGDHARALRLLDDHSKSFPRSMLAEERSLGRIQALCGLGRRAQAQSAIDAFVRRHPGSPLTGRVKKACPEPETNP